MKRHLVLSEEELPALAAEVAAELPPDATLYLSGELGSGKTTFTRLLLDHHRADPPATSPTFAIMNVHALPDGRSALHADLYRLDNPDDVATLGLLEAMADPNSLVIVEWPEKGAPLLPPPHLHLHFSHHTPETRVITTL